MSLLKPKRLLLLCMISLAILSLSVASVYVAIHASSTLPFADCKYVVREHMGFVAVFIPNSTEPKYLTDMPVALLPKADRELLSVGIGIESEVELTALLEDYS